MGEVSLNSASLLSSIASMYDNHLFSDVQLIFVNENGESGRMYCHSFILAIRSRKFALMFFDDLKKETPHKVKLPSGTALSFSHLVRFLYTDNLQLDTFEEAQKLFDLAKEYGVEELEKKCSNYILNEKLNIDNLFSKYEYALGKGMHMLLKECQNFVCLNSQQVLESDDFTNASSDIVEDILKLDNLSVLTEVEVIGALLKWGSEELKRRNLSLDEKNLRKCIDPLKKHVRFLTLSRTEFDYLTDRYDIFSSKECSKLTQKIIDPLCDVILPESLSSINTKRTGKVGSNSSSVSLHKNTSSNFYANKTFPSVQSCSGSDSLIKNDESNKVFNFSAKHTQSALSPNNLSFDRSLKRLTSEDFSKSLSSSLFSLQVSPESLKSLSNSGASGVPKLPASDTNKVSYEVTKVTPFEETSRRKHLLDKVTPPPSVREISYLPQTMMNGSSRLRDFEFSLLESSPCFRTSFQNDVKSSISFQMITGNILLHGFEIKVKNKSDKAVEELDIDVDLEGFSKQPFSELYKEKLNNNLIFIKLPNNMVLQAGNKGKLEVSIDNLLLNRCCNCNSNKPLQLNCGNSFKCGMSLNSTQKTDGGDSLFLVSKLIYVPC